MKSISSVELSLAAAEAPKKNILSNGVRVVTEKIQGVQSLSIGVWVNVGSRDEMKSVNGISHFIEHMVFKGTTGRKAHHIAQYLEAVGGYVNAYTTKDSTCYYARVLSLHLGRALNLLADLVVNATLPMKEIEKEKFVIIEEMRGADDDPEDSLHDKFEKLLYGSHPLGQPVIGHENTVRSLTRDKLLSHIGRYYTAPNIIVTAAGAVEHDKVLEYAEQAFASVPVANAVRRRKPQVIAAERGVWIRDIQQSHIILGNVAEGYARDTRMALYVFSALLGEGMSSRLFQRIRERYGFTYNIYSFVNSYTDVSTLGVYLAVQRGSEQRAVEYVFREIEGLAHKNVSVRELNRAKEQVIGGMLLGLESMSSRMTRLGKDELGPGHDVPLALLVHNIRELTPESIREIAASFLAGEGPAVATLLSESQPS